MTDSFMMADSIRYGRYKQYKHQAQEVINLCKRAIKHARTFMNLPDGIEFVVRPIGKGYNGTYINTLKKVELDPRRVNMGCILVTLMHELVHAEQFHTGRLKHQFGTFHWNDSPFKPRRSISYAAYRSLPWEIEAFDRQEELAKRVAAMIVEEVKDVA